MTCQHEIVEPAQSYEVIDSGTGQPYHLPASGPAQDGVAPLAIGPTTQEPGPAAHTTKGAHMVTDQQRKDAYEAKFVAATVALKVASRLGGMKTGFSSAMQSMVAMEITVQVRQHDRDHPDHRLPGILQLCAPDLGTSAAWHHRHSLDSSGPGTLKLLPGRRLLSSAAHRHSADMLRPGGHLEEPP